VSGDRARAALVDHLVAEKGVTAAEADGVVAAIEREAATCMGMFAWMRGKRAELLSIGWEVVLAKWDWYDPASGPPGPYFRMVLAHDVKRLIRNEDPRRRWTRGKNKPHVLARLVSVAHSSEADGEAGERDPNTLALDTFVVKEDPLDVALSDEAELVRMHAALLAACGGDEAELQRVLDAERSTDPEGVELRARRRAELKVLREYGQWLGLEGR
jgi:hypothetical protein